MEDPSRVIVTARVAGLGTGTLDANATFASKGICSPFIPHYYPFYDQLTVSSAAAIHLARNLAIERSALVTSSAIV